MVKKAHFRYLKYGNNPYACEWQSMTVEFAQRTNSESYDAWMAFYATEIDHDEAFLDYIDDGESLRLYGTL